MFNSFPFYRHNQHCGSRKTGSLAVRLKKFRAITASDTNANARTIEKRRDQGNQQACGLTSSPALRPLNCFAPANISKIAFALAERWLKAAILAPLHRELFAIRPVTDC